MEYTTLGALIKPAKTIRCGDGNYPVLSMTMHDGIMLQSDRFKKSLASVDQSNYKVVKRGQLVIGFPIDEGVLYLQEIEDEGIMSPAYNVWDINTDLIEPKFLEFCLHSPQAMSFYKNNLRGSTARRRTIPTDVLLSLPIPKIDFEKQKRATEIITRCKYLKDIANLQLEQLDQLVKSRFVEMFGIGNNLNSVTLADVTTIITDGTHQPPKFQNSGIPFIFVSNIVTNELTYDAEKFINQETYDELYKRTPIEIGDVLLSTVGSYGHPAIVKKNDKFLFQRHIAYLKPIREKINSVYLHAVILTDNVQRQIDKAVKGIAQKTLNLSEIKKLTIPLPPLKLQNQFAAFVQQVDKSKFIIKQSLEQLELLKKKLMQDYFG